MEQIMSIIKVATGANVLKPDLYSSSGKSNLLFITRQVVEGSALWNRAALDAVAGEESNSQLGISYSIAPKVKQDTIRPNIPDLSTSSWNEFALEELLRKA